MSLNANSTEENKNKSLFKPNPDKPFVISPVPPKDSSCSQGHTHSTEQPTD